MCWGYTDYEKTTEGGGLTMVMLVGCTHYDHPVAIHGKYYMVGNNNCRRVVQTPQQGEQGIVSCYTNDGMYTGDRTAMTDQDMQLYMLRRQEEIARQRAWAATMMNAVNQMQQAQSNIQNTYYQSQQSMQAQQMQMQQMQMERQMMMQQQQMQNEMHMQRMQQLHNEIMESYNPRTVHTDCSAYGPGHVSCSSHY